MRLTLITAHAALAVAALGLGLWSWRRRSLLAAYEAALTGAMMTLLAAIFVDWPTLNPVSRWVFVAFLALGAAMIIAVERGRHAADHRWPLGFTLVALTDGFIAIAVLDTGASTAVVVAVGVAVALVGHLVLRRLISGSVQPKRPHGQRPQSSPAKGEQPPSFPHSAS